MRDAKASMTIYLDACDMCVCSPTLKVLRTIC